MVLPLGATVCSRDNSASGGPQAAQQSTGATALGSTWADAARMPDLFSGMWMTFSSFDLETNTYTDKDPEEVVKMLERKAGR
jgi:hypothetical protein